jgi:MFS family permease
MDRRLHPGFPQTFYLSLLCTLLLFFGMQALMPTLPLYVLQLGGTPADNGLVQWVLALASVLTRPLAGVLADRFGDRPVLLVGALLFGGAPPFYALCPNLPTLLVIRVFHGAGLALYTTAYRALATQLAPPARRGEALGLIGTVSSATMGVAPLVGEALASSGGFAALSGLLAGVGLAALAISLLLPGRRRPEGFEEYVGLRAAVRERGVRRGAAAMALLGVPYAGLVGFLSLLAQARELGPTGWAYAAFAVTAMAGGPLSGRLSDRWGRRRVVVPGALLVALAAVGLAMVTSQGGMVGLLALYGLGWGTLRTGLDASVQDSAGPVLRGSATAAQYTAFDLAIGLSSWGLGALVGGVGYGWMFGLGALAAVVAALVP